MGEQFRSAIVVDDHALLARDMGLALQAVAGSVFTCTTYADAIAALRDGERDLMVTDLNLPDGSGLDLIHLVSLITPNATIVAVTGSADRKKCFEAAQYGASALLEKPFDLEWMVSRVVAAYPSHRLEQTVRGVVGCVPMPDVIHSVRTTMVAEALMRTRGCITHAAEMIGVTRPAVQYVRRGRKA